MVKKIFLIGLFILMSGFPYARTAQAASDFALEFDVSYVFDEQGNAKVTKRISLINLNTETYPSVYLVDVPNDSSSIAGFDEKGKLELETIQEAGRKIIRVPLEKQNVGVNQKTNITLSYETRALSSKETDIWQIVIPPFSADESIISYDTMVITPESWGDTKYTYPQTAENGKWTLQERGEENIVLIYGDFQNQLAGENKINNLSPLIALSGIISGIVLSVLLYLYIRRKKYNI